MTDDLMSLAADLTAAGAKVRPLVKKALQVTGGNIREEWSANAGVGGAQGVPEGYPSSITFEARETVSAVEVEVGPEMGRPGGPAGNFLESGTIHRPPQHAGRNALEANEQDFIDGLAIAMVDAIEK